MKDSDVVRILNQEIRFLVSEIDKEIAAAEDRIQENNYLSGHLLYEDMGFIKGTSRIFKAYKEFIEDMIRRS